MADIGYALMLIGGFVVILLVLRCFSGRDRPEQRRPERTSMNQQSLPALQPSSAAEGRGSKRSS